MATRFCLSDSNDHGFQLSGRHPHVLVAHLPNANAEAEVDEPFSFSLR